MPIYKEATYGSPGATLAALSSAPSGFMSLSNRVPSLFAANDPVYSGRPLSERSLKQLKLNEQADREREALWKLAQIQSPSQAAETDLLRQQSRSLRAAPRQEENERNRQTVLSGQQSEASRQFQAEQAAQQQANLESLARQQQAAEQALLSQRARLSEDAFTNRLAAVQRIPGTAQVQHPGGVTGNETAARAAAFGRARDIQGTTARSALRALQGLHEQSGTTGSTMEAMQQGRVVGGAEAGISDFLTQQLLSDLSRAAEISDLQYKGGITQRGQDIDLQQALIALANMGPLY